LDWQPSVPLEQGLKETIPYFAAKLREEGYQVVGKIKN
jgi:nucleoside-diphosphate-sugar epimerase